MQSDLWLMLGAYICFLYDCQMWHLIYLLSSSRRHFRWHKQGYYYPALHVFGSEVVVARGPVTTAGAVSHQSSKASNWTAALWKAKCWGSKHSPVYWVVLVRRSVDVTPRRCSRPSDWIDSANMVPKLSFTHHCQLPSSIPCLFLSSSICNQFLWFML